MSKTAGLNNEQSSILTQAEQIQEQMNQFSARDLQLRSIGVLGVLVVAAFTMAFVMPNLMWARNEIRIENAYLPQVFFGLISLVLLFNIYLLAQKASLNITRRALIGELVLNERLESLSLVDPVTQLLNRRAMGQLIPKEVARANRLGANLTFMKIDVSGFAEINAKAGAAGGNVLLAEFGKLLKAVFRGGDIVFRQGGDEFLVAMPDTTEQQCDPPLQRLLGSVEQWNLNSTQPYELSFRWAFAAYSIGSNFEETLRTLDRKVYKAQNKLAPVS